MAQLSLNNGNKKTGPDGNVNWAINIGNAVPDANGVLNCLVQITVATTGIKFCVGALDATTMDANAYNAPLATKFWISFKPGIQQLMWQMGVATDEFFITV